MSKTDDFQKIKLEVQNKIVLADGNVLKTKKEELYCDVKNGTKVR